MNRAAKELMHEAIGRLVRRYARLESDRTPCGLRGLPLSQIVGLFSVEKDGGPVSDFYNLAWSDQRAAIRNAVRRAVRRGLIVGRRGPWKGMRYYRPDA